MTKRKASDGEEENDGEWSARYVCNPNAALAILEAAEKVGGGCKEMYLVCEDDRMTFRAADGGNTRLLEAVLKTPNACNLSGKPSPLCFSAPDFALIMKQGLDTVCCIDINSKQDEITVFFHGDLDTENVFEEMLSFNFDEGADVARFELKKFDFNEFPTDEVSIKSAFNFVMPAEKLMEVVRSGAAFGAERLHFDINVKTNLFTTRDETVVAIHYNGRVKFWERLKFYEPRGKGCSVKYLGSMRGGSVENSESEHNKNSVYSSQCAYGIKSLNAALSSFKGGDLKLQFDRSQGHLLAKFPVDTNAVITVVIGADVGEQ